MAKMRDLALLHQGAIIVAETDDQTDLEVVAGFEFIKEKHLGKTIIRFYRKE